MAAGFALDRGVDHFGSAFFTLPNTASLVQETLSSQLDIRSPFLLDQSFLKVPFLIGCTKYPPLRIGVIVLWFVSLCRLLEKGYQCIFDREHSH
jgi:hypothetical protein